MAGAGTRTFQTLQKIAASLDGVEEGIACEGTAVESRTFKVGGKAFLFLRPQDARFKLAASIEEASAFAAKAPQACVVGSGGWAHLKFEPGPVPAAAVLKKWVTESYGFMSGGGRSSASTVRNAPAKATVKRKAAGKPRK